MHSPLLQNTSYLHSTTITEKKQLIIFAVEDTTVMLGQYLDQHLSPMMFRLIQPVLLHLMI